MRISDISDSSGYETTIEVLRSLSDIETKSTESGSETDSDVISEIRRSLSDWRESQVQLLSRLATGAEVEQWVKSAGAPTPRPTVVNPRIAARDFILRVTRVTDVWQTRQLPPEALSALPSRDVEALRFAESLKERVGKRHREPFVSETIVRFGSFDTAYATLGFVLGGMSLSYDRWYQSTFDQSSWPNQPPVGFSASVWIDSLIDSLGEVKAAGPTFSHTWGHKFLMHGTERIAQLEGFGRSWNKSSWETISWNRN